MTHQNANFRAFVDAVEAVEAIRREADDESSSFPMWEATSEARQYCNQTNNSPCGLDTSLRGVMGRNDGVAQFPPNFRALPKTRPCMGGASADPPPTDRLHVAPSAKRTCRSDRHAG